MKLLWCMKCHDIVALRIEERRTCFCTSLGGQYNADGVTATIGGNGKVIGIANPFLSGQLLAMSPYERDSFRQKYYPEGKGQDVWFGEYDGDVQLIKVSTSSGPRVKVSTRLTDDSKGIILHIHDRRKFRIGEQIRRKEILLPYYQGMVLNKKAV